MTREDFHPGQRVQTHPATDAWMQGDRYGVVRSIGGIWIHVTLDSGRCRKMRPADLIPVPAWQQIPKGS